MNNIELINLIPKFLDFYERANLEWLDDEERWKLWKENYNFAAVPPGEEGQKIAKSLFYGAWEKYKKNINYIENWKGNLTRVENCLKEVKSLLGYDKPINLVLIYFVGGFENNAFVAPYDQERLALCIPIECGDSDITLSHELTHVVHSKTANLTPNWERTIASTILQEGLATQVSKFIVPGKPDEKYIEHKQGWFNSCKLVRAEIIKGIVPYFDDSSSEVITKFTFGTGTTNHDREVYFVGWEIVTALLEQGVTFKEIASVQEEKIPNYLRECYSLLN
ncbi:DUF2268 domain-containing putative Zn-dependent protease [Lysinibacillus sp. SGAir0095]|uniref:DUF2268 domain-containing putative Zn-dependent protease n=1 Tax=Lysinibacillus sp. SGAir0095 TaxID=2070463 RepID=UPI00143CCB15|nr:DUF2268 domain-containing putative Zn-dependent protease [Lysinibacillus sp. SGAir0095]